MEKSVENIVLRYRDLSSKNTIDLHDSIIKKHKYVWWGWWAKPQEKVALEVFSILKDCARKDGLDLFLLDSGREELRKAKCVDIEFSTLGKPIKTPQKSITPKYYNKSEYMIWFKLAEITDTIPNPNQYINQYSYIKIDEHFASRISPFEAFDNKKVYNLSELIEQQCTIWYLRKASEQDEDRQIVSYAPGIGSISESFNIDKSNRLLWLSDLHFSKEHHAFKNKTGSDKSLFKEINNKLDAMSYKTFSRLLVTGDFTFVSSTDEFSQAKKFFDEISSVYGFSGEQIALCPGNHDMEYAKDEYTDDSEVVLTYEDAKQNYIDFFEQVCGVRANEYTNSIQRFITSNGKLVELICLNTCILQQDKSHFRGMGFAGDNQLDYLKKVLKSSENMNSIRILAMHHNMLPVAYSEEPQVNPMYSILLDSEAISSFCVENNVSIVLHGHTHKDFYTEVTRKTKDGKKKTFFVVGLGSTGAIQNDLSEGSHNQFAIIRFEKTHMRILIYPINAVGSNSNNDTIAEHIIPYRENRHEKIIDHRFG